MTPIQRLVRERAAAALPWLDLPPAPPDMTAADLVLGRARTLRAVRTPPPLSPQAAAAVRACAAAGALADPGADPVFPGAVIDLDRAQGRTGALLAAVVEAVDRSLSCSGVPARHRLAVADVIGTDALTSPDGESETLSLLRWACLPGARG